MDRRQRTLAVVILTFMVTLAVVFLTEDFYQSMVFSWNIEEGTVLVFDVRVTGSISSGNTTFPPSFAQMNNTRISATIVSLPNVSIIFYSSDFLENVVGHLKTQSRFVNGTDIPVEFRNPINTHISQCILPTGGWRHLDSFFPNHIDNPSSEHESYLSAFQQNLFYFGYSSNQTTEADQWYGIIDIDTGTPQVVSFWIYRTSVLTITSYGVTLILVP